MRWPDDQPVDRRADIRPHGSQQPLGVVARRNGFGDGGGTAGGEAGKQQRTLHLGARHR